MAKRMTYTKYIVMADNQIPDYAANNEEVYVFECKPGLFYASSEIYGEGNCRDTHEAAIVELLQTHACTNIRADLASA